MEKRKQSIVVELVNLIQVLLAWNMESVINNGGNIYGMKIEKTEKMFPNGC